MHCGKWARRGLQQPQKSWHTERKEDHSRLGHLQRCGCGETARGGTETRVRGEAVISPSPALETGSSQLVTESRRECCQENSRGFQWSRHPARDPDFILLLPQSSNQRFTLAQPAESQGSKEVNSVTSQIRFAIRRTEERSGGKSGCQRCT